MSLSTYQRTGLVLMLALLAAALWWWTRSDERVRAGASHLGMGEAAAPSALPADEGSSALPRQAPGPAAARPDLTSATGLAPPPTPVVVAANEVQANPNAHLLALSPEEAAWLDRHGYPTEEELAQVPFLDLRDLERRHDAKDLNATVLLAHKLLDEGELDDAWTVFNIAAQRGSLYAREQSAIVGAIVDRTRSPKLAHEYTLVALDMEIARIFGDHRVDALIRRELPPGAITPVVQSGVLAALPVQLQLIAEDAKLRGVPPPSPDPRPNGVLWEQIDAGTVSEATVYPRSSRRPGGP